MYKMLFFVASLAVVQNSYAEVLGLALLTNKEKNRKVIILYDRHDKSTVTPLAKEQREELQKLLEALSKLKTESSFFIELAYRTINFKRTDDSSTIHVPIKAALKNDMKLGNIQFVPFDERGEIYFWFRELIVDLDEVNNAIQRGYKVPKEYTNSTLQAFLDGLTHDEKEAQDLLAKLPEPVQKLMSKKMEIFDKAQIFMKEQITANKIDKKDHLKVLIDKVGNIPTFREQYADMLVAAGSITSDLSLMTKVLNDKNPVTVVHAGLYHAQQLEDALRAVGFEDAYPEIDLKYGLDARDLSNITYPKSIVAYLLHPIFRFLGLCEVCGVETSKKCSACKSVYFCGVGCQRAGWKLHKMVCQKVEIKK